LARALIVACGCRGRELGAELARGGWQVRGTSRSRDGVEAIERAGFEGALADPERPGTVLELVGDVTAVVWLLGSAVGEPDLLRAIHGPRLEHLIARLVDTPVRAFAYEAVGSAGEGNLAAGRALVAKAAETWRIPTALLEQSRDRRGWAAAAAAQVRGALG
jgi:uncharacterized protein YbjT (DUF2867 family)